MRKINPFKYKLMRSYHEVFLGKDGKPNESAKIVLNDLRRFCNARIVDSVLETDPIQMAAKEGARQAYSHIMQYLFAREDDCYEIEMEDYINE